MVYADVFKLMSIVVTYLANILCGSKTNNYMTRPVNIAVLIAKGGDRLLKLGKSERSKQGCQKLCSKNHKRSTNVCFTLIKYTFIRYSGTSI